MPFTLRSSSQALAAVQRHARPLAGDGADDDHLVRPVGDARFVLLGEASHGSTSSTASAPRITRRLIEERGFAAVAVEADWPDAYRVNRYVRGRRRRRDADEALAGFQRFPDLDVAQRRRARLRRVAARAQRRALPPTARAGFYGLDLYSLHTSIEAVLALPRRVDPEAARRARAATPASTTSARTPGLRLRGPASTSTRAASTRSSRQLSSCAAAPARSRAAWRTATPTSSSTPSRTRAW